MPKRRIVDAMNITGLVIEMPNVTIYQSKYYLAIYLIYKAK